VGKRNLSLPAVSCKKKVNFFCVINSSLIKLVGQAGWISVCLSCTFHKRTKRTLTSHLDLLLVNNPYYYMASSVSVQDESCTVIGYPSGQDGAILPARDYQLHLSRKISPKAILIMNPLLTKLVQLRWLDLSLVLLLPVNGPRLLLGP